jgi:hypothetical protein
MTYADLVNNISLILPNATFGEDNDGQLIIYTDLRESLGGEKELVPVCGDNDARPTCILTGALGENSDDCTTHEHE